MADPRDMYKEEKSRHESNPNSEASTDHMDQGGRKNFEESYKANEQVSTWDKMKKNVFGQE